MKLDKESISYVLMKKEMIVKSSLFCGSDGGSIEPLVKILELIRLINEEKRVKQESIIFTEKTIPRKINSKKSRKVI